jgi:putative tricarboxylic transport membrane protein
MKNFDLVSGLIWLVLGISLCIGSIPLKFGDLHKPGPGFTPFLAGSFLGVLGLILVLSSIFGRLEEQKIMSAKKGNWKSLLPTLLALFGFVLLFEFLGFFITSFLFFLFLFKLGNPKRWLVPLVFSAVTVLLCYLIFSVWLTCPFPRGIFRL